MKRLSILLFAVISVTVCCLQAEAASRQDGKLNVKIKQRIAKLYCVIYEAEAPVKISTGTDISKYDNNRNIIEEERYVGCAPNQLLYFRETYKYDDRSNKIKSAELYLCNTNSIKWKYLSAYDDNGNVVEKTQYANGYYKKKSIYKYDGKGNKVEEADYEPDGAMDSKSTYKYAYDSKGNKIEESGYKVNGDLDYKNAYKYDNNGKVIEQVRYQAAGALSWKNLYKYDDRGSLVEDAVYKENVALPGKRIYKYVYDNNGNVIEKASYAVREKFGELVEIMTEFTEYQYSYY